METLRSTLDGAAWTAQDSSYAESIFAWNVSTNHPAEVVVDAANEQDVLRAVGWASQRGMTVSTQATGHGQHRPCAGMLVRTRSLKSVVVDREKRTARVGAGCQWSDVLQAAAPYGLGAMSGSAQHVGMVGYTLGGGVGLMLRKHGLAVDKVRSARVVLADGSLVEASRTQDADLFWALMGGGGAFGVVTEMEIELVPVGDFYGGAAFWDVAHAPQVFDRYAAWAADLPEEATTSLHVMNFPRAPFIPEPLRGRSMVYITAAIVGAGDRAESLVQEMRGWPGHEFDSFRPMPYTESGSVHSDPVDPLPFRGGGALLHRVDATSLAQVLEAFGEPQASPHLMLQIRALGGAASRNETGPMSPLRQAGGVVYMLGLALPDLIEPAKAHEAAFMAGLGDNLARRGPLNWVGENDTPAERYRNVYTDEDWSRLVRIKNQVDPQNVFRHASVGLVLAEIGG